MSFKTRGDEDYPQQQFKEFSVASTNGFNFGKSIIAMIDAMPLRKDERDEFIKGLNSAVFKEFRNNNDRYNNGSSADYRTNGKFQGYQNNDRKPFVQKIKSEV